MRDVQTSMGELPSSAFSDPARVAEANLTAVGAQHPPLRLATGTHAVTEIRAALSARLAELDAWEDISVEVDSVGAA